MIDSIKIGISFALAIAITALIIITVYPTITNDSVSLENITFASNNTDYDLAYSTNYLLDPYTPVLYYFGNTTFSLPASNYVFGDGVVKIYANGTGSYPNITNGTSAFYYANYQYYKEIWLGGTNYLWLISILLFIGFFAVCLKFLSML